MTSSLEEVVIVAEFDLLDFYYRASGWTLTNVRCAVGWMDRQTLCEAWDVHARLNHMLDMGR